MTTKKILDMVVYNTKKDRYEDQINNISIVHRTGHITATTIKGKHFAVKFDDLVTELQIEVIPDIKNKQGANVFSDIVTITYCQNKASEVKAIVELTDIPVINSGFTKEFKIPYVELGVHVSSELVDVQEIQIPTGIALPTQKSILTYNQ